jgi:predicted nucleic acid-binding protein
LGEILSVYLDASVLAALFTDDPFSARADVFVSSERAGFFVSDFGAAEFASVIARHVRTNELSIGRAREALNDFDERMVQLSTRVEIVSSDVRAVETMLRRLDLPLRAPDAIHIAIAQRLGAELATFDEKMAACARALGAPVVAI